MAPAPARAPPMLTATLAAVDAPSSRLLVVPPELEGLGVSTMSGRMNVPSSSPASGAAVWVILSRMSRSIRQLSLKRKSGLSVLRF